MVCLLVTTFAFSGFGQEATSGGDSAASEEVRRCSSWDWDREYHRVVTEKYFVGENDDIVRYKEYRRPGRVKAYVIFLNGRTEFLEKYDPMFTSLTEVPWETSRDQTLANLPVTFYALDHAGQGESGGLRSHIDDYDVFTANLLSLIRRERRLRRHRKPIYLMAHSMGGMIAARFAQQYPEYVDGLILGSPMFGVNPPFGTFEELKQLAAAYSVGFGFADRCAVAVDPTVLGSLAWCMAPGQEACQSCLFGDPAVPQCAPYGFDWAAMGAGLELLSSDQIISCEGVVPRTPEYSCTFPGEGFAGTSRDYDYCFWTESHPLAGPYYTFGWLHQSFIAMEELFMPENLDMVRDIPTLLLTTDVDPIVDPASHHSFCDELNNCELVHFESNFETGPAYFHELFAEVDRASVLDEVRDFLRHPRCKDGRGRRCHRHRHRHRH
jgi:alpha-beta hydrolase superfamily lysophospholipase